MSAGASTGYVVPRYRADGAAFHHVLHGTVPGHQIDFLYCPEVPQGALRPTHFGHLARLIKYIEPRDGAPYAFAIGNLSRDDVQHSPGHGGVAVLFALRVHGVVDHAGRDMPPYAHGVIAVDRELTYGALLRTVTALHGHFLEREGAEDRRGDFYRTYVRTMRESPGEVPDFLARAIREFGDLPSPPRSALGWDYVADGGEGPRQIALLYEEPMEIGMIAHWASRIVAFLYRSNIKWTSVSTGREIDIAGGTTIRFVPRSEARSGQPGCSHDLDDLPDDEEALAALLFGARRRVLPAARPARGWREALAAHRPEAAVAVPSPPEPSDADRDLDVDVDMDADADADADIDVDIDFPPTATGTNEPPAGLVERSSPEGNEPEAEGAPDEKSGPSEGSEGPRPDYEHELCTNRTEHEPRSAEDPCGTLLGLGPRPAQAGSRTHDSHAATGTHDSHAGIGTRESRPSAATHDREAGAGTHEPWARTATHDSHAGVGAHEPQASVGAREPGSASGAREPASASGVREPCAEEGGPREPGVESWSPEGHTAREAHGQEDAGPTAPLVATRSEAGERESDENEVDDAAATIPVATLPGGGRRPPPFAAAPRPAPAPVLTPAFLPVEKEIAGTAAEDEENELRPRAAGHRLLIVAALAAVAAAIVLIVAAGLNIAGSPAPGEHESIDAPPSAEPRSPRAAPPASADPGKNGAGERRGPTNKPVPTTTVEAAGTPASEVGKPDGGTAGSARGTRQPPRTRKPRIPTGQIQPESDTPTVKPPPTAEF